MTPPSPVVSPIDMSNMVFFLFFAAFFFVLFFFLIFKKLKKTLILLSNLQFLIIFAQYEHTTYDYVLDIF